jgi:tetratricopeptide (TPR) repeat protein
MRRQISSISIPLLAMIVIFFALNLRLLPRLIALYHQEQGARVLARALLAEGRAGEGGLWLEPEPLTRPDAQALAAQALERFQAAIAADPANFQAYRWLGRAALLLDRPGDAVAAFSAAVRLRPDNPLVWWELGLAYDRLAPPMPFSWGDKPEEEGPASAGELSQPALIDRTSSPPRRIPAVGVEAHAVESSAGAPLPVWGYARWLLPDAPGGWPGWWVPDEPVPRTVLFAAVPATVTFRVSLPVTPTALVFWMGMDPALQAPQGDGVVYRVRVEDQEVFSHTLRPQEARAGWWPARADLTPWAGRTVRLTLSLDPNPAGDTDGDWAGWGDVQLVEAVRAGGVLADAERRSVAAWRAGRISAEQLIEAGEERQRKGRYVDAIRLYRAAGIEGRIDTFEPAVPLSMVIIESFVDAGAWLPCNWCGNVDGRFETHNGVLEMSYKNNLEKRDGFAYLSRPDVLISNYRELLLRLKGESGTLLTVEIVVDGGRTRPLNYQPVPQDWDVWIIPIQGNVLNEILIGIGELEPVLTPLEYHLSIDWIALR